MRIERNPLLIIGAFVVLLVGAPVSHWWWTHDNHPFERLARERAAEAADAGAVDAAVVDPCTVRWRAGGDGGTAIDTATAAHANKHAARIKIPIAAFGIKGLAKLRYSEEMEMRIEAEDLIEAEVKVPCLDLDASNGVRAGDCKLGWSDVVEIAECTDR